MSLLMGNDTKYFSTICHEDIINHIDEVMNFIRRIKVIPRCVIRRFLFIPPEMSNDIKMNETLWNPMNIFASTPNYKYGMVILNQPILLNKCLVLPMWTRAQIKVCVDGGTNQWMKYLNKIADEVYRGNCLEYRPTFITGDCDSILPDIIAKLRNIAVPIIKTPDQHHTDYSKALMQLASECKQKNIHLDAVYVLVETAGRFDHIMGNINTLHNCRKYLGNIDNVINIASNSLTWLLHPGKHVIKIPEVLRKHKSWVGLIPLSTPINNVTTTGLKWNLDNTTLSFGGMVSTSNTYDGSPEVTVITNAKIIWTMGIEPLVAIENNLD